MTRYDSRAGAGPMPTDSSASSTCAASRSASEYTATVPIPMRRAVLMTRHAISPRLATKIFLNIALKRDVSVFAPWIGELLVAQHRERSADAAASPVRKNHIVDVAASAGNEDVGELRLVLCFAGGQPDPVVLLFAKDDLDGTLGAHDGNLGIRPGEIHVAAQVFRGHHVVGAAIGLSRDHGNLRDGALRIRV